MKCCVFRFQNIFHFDEVNPNLNNEQWWSCMIEIEGQDIKKVDFFLSFGAIRIVLGRVLCCSFSRRCRLQILCKINLVCGFYLCII